MSKNGNNKAKVKPPKPPKRPKAVADVYRDPDKVRFTSLFKRHHPAATTDGG